MGNLIEFNPDDYIIEELNENDGPTEVVVPSLVAPSQIGSEKPKSIVSRPKSANRLQASRGRRLAAKRIRKVIKEGE